MNGITKQVTDNIKGLFAQLEEGFRSRTRNLSEVLLNKINNPTPRSELFPYLFFNEKESLYYLEGNIAGFTFECDQILPAVGQGIIAVQCRKDDEIKNFND